MALKGQRVRFQGGQGPTGIIEDDEPDEDGFVNVYWGFHDGQAVRSGTLYSELEPAPPNTEPPDALPGVE